MDLETKKLTVEQLQTEINDIQKSLVSLTFDIFRFLFFSCYDFFLNFLFKGFRFKVLCSYASMVTLNRWCWQLCKVLINCKIGHLVNVEMKSWMWESYDVTQTRLVTAFLLWQLNTLTIFLICLRDLLTLHKYASRGHLTDLVLNGNSPMCIN